MKKKDDFALKAFAVVALAYVLAFCALIWQRAGFNAAFSCFSIALAGFIVGRHLKLSKLDDELEAMRDEYKRRLDESDDGP